MRERDGWSAASGARSVPRVLMVGDHQADEFAEAFAWLAAHTDLCRATMRDGITGGGCPADWLPQVVIVVQQRPGEWSAAEREQWSQRFPLARLVVLLGAWCEGELRSGRPWSGVPRVYWHQWQSLAVPQFQRFPWGGWWQQPRTATPAEIVLGAAAQEIPRASGMVAVAAADRTTYDVVKEALAAGGFGAAWWPWEVTALDDAFVAGVVQLRGGLRSDCRAVPRLARALGGRPLVGLAEFPRPGDVRRWQRWGVTAVVSRPCGPLELVGELAQLTTSRRAVRRESAA